MTTRCATSSTTAAAPTPLATSPTWRCVLRSCFPIHTHRRMANTLSDSLNHSNTLPDRPRHHGYHRAPRAPGRVLLRRPRPGPCPCHCPCALLPIRPPADGAPAGQHLPPPLRFVRGPAASTASACAHNGSARPAAGPCLPNPSRQSVNIDRLSHTRHLFHTNATPLQTKQEVVLYTHPGVPAGATATIATIVPVYHHMAPAPAPPEVSSMRVVVV